MVDGVMVVFPICRHEGRIRCKILLFKNPTNIFWTIQNVLEFATSKKSNPTKVCIIYVCKTATVAQMYVIYANDFVFPNVFWFTYCAVTLWFLM